MFRLRSLLLAAPLVSLGACATTVELPAWPDCHPANARAATTPLPDPWGLLQAHHPIAAAELPVGGDPAGHQHLEASPPGAAGSAMDDPHAHHGADAMEREQGAGATGAAGFTCSLHPEVRSPAPGHCPRCGMTLQPVEQAASHPHAGHAGHAVDDAEPAGNGEERTVYSCPMHPEVRAAEPGSCPICGMALAPAEESATDPHAGHAVDDAEPAEDGDEGTVYSCPMHPEVRSAEPGNCPICGMALEPAEESATDPHARHAADDDREGRPR